MQERLRTGASPSRQRARSFLRSFLAPATQAIISSNGLTNVVSSNYFGPLFILSIWTPEMETFDSA